MMYTRYSGA